MTTGARGKQPNLGFLDPILCLAPLAVQVVVEFLWLIREVGHHVARVVALLAVLQARDHCCRRNQISGLDVLDGRSSSGNGATII